MVVVKEVEDPERFGVAEIEGGKIINIIEKPDRPKTNLAVLGVYFYDKNVFDYIKTLKKSDRQELEVTDLNNIYVEKDEMTYSKMDGWWTDAGTFESLKKANDLMGEEK